MADHAKVCGLRLESIEELFSVAHVQADVDARVRLLEGTQDIGQDVDPDRRVAEDAEHAPTQTLELIDGAAGSAALGEDPTGMLVQQDSGIRQPGPVDRRLEERHADGPSEALHLVGDGGLAEMQDLRRAREAAQVGHRLEHPELVDRDARFQQDLERGLVAQVRMVRHSPCRWMSCVQCIGPHSECTLSCPSTERFSGLWRSSAHGVPLSTSGSRIPRSRSSAPLSRRAHGSGSIGQAVPSPACPSICWSCSSSSWSSS